VNFKERNPTLFEVKKQKYRMTLAKYMGITSKNGDNIAESGIYKSYCIVHGVSAHDKPVEPISDKCNVQLPVVYTTPWMMNKVKIGSYLPASALKQLLPGLEQVPDSFLQGKRIRQFAQGQVDREGNDIGGFFVLSDVATAVLFESVKSGQQYANNPNLVNSLRAPSLKYIDSGHSNVSLLF